MSAICSIRAIRDACGALRPVESLARDEASAAQAARLKERGFGTFAHSELTPPDLGGQAAQATLAAAGLAPEDVPAVIYASNSMWRPEFYDPPGVQRMMVRLGLTRSQLLGVFLSSCSNCTDALRHAANLVRAEGLKNVLVIVTDCVDPERGARMPPGDYAVLGDAAVGYLVGPPGEGDFDVLGIGSAFNGKVCEYDYASGAYMLAVAIGMREAVDRACQAAATTRAEISRMVMSNLQPRLCRATVKGLGLTHEQWHPGRLAELAHCYAADTLVNLVEMQRTAPCGPGEQILLYSQSGGSWGAALVRPTPGP